MKERYDSEESLSSRLRRLLGSHACKAEHTAARHFDTPETVDNSNIHEHVDLRKAEYWADTILDRYWDGEYPVDPNAIAVAMGMDVYFARIPGRLAGLILKTADQSMPSIFVDEGASTPRKRFTIAHEIGHYVETQGLRDPETPSKEVFGFSDAVMTDDKKTPIFRKTDHEISNQSPSERFANYFARLLLIPESELARFVDTNLGPRDMAAYFGVSTATINRRLNDAYLTGRTKILRGHLILVSKSLGTGEGYADKKLFHSTTRKNRLLNNDGLERPQTFP